MARTSVSDARFTDARACLRSPIVAADQGWAAAMHAVSAGVCVKPQLPSSWRAHVAAW